jgi:23S rRNA pseudouridine1911/1915/1917 synthase
MADSKLATIIDEDCNGKRFDQALAVLFPDYSRARLQNWIKQGRALLDGAVVQPRTRVKTGQAVELDAVVETIGEPAPEPMQLDIVFEDEHIMVINKPAGLVVHPGAGNPAGTLMNGLLHHAPELGTLPRAGILHRLDKDTTGLLMIARSVRAHTRLVRDMEERKIRREYRAVCNDRLVAGATVDAPVGRDPGHRTRMKVTSTGKPAVTHYRVLARFAMHSFIAVRLETGRTHQIRVHMMHTHHPLIGDPVYGGRLRVPAGSDEQLTAALQGFKRPALHAYELGFEHPDSGAAMRFQAPLPQDLLDLLHALAPRSALDFGALQWPES